MFQIARIGGLLRVGIVPVVVLFLSLEVAGAADRARRSADDGLARRILDASGIQGGLVVHLGCGDGRLTSALGVGDSFLVQGLDTDAGNVEKARGHLRSLGVYSKVVADTFDGEHLPYTDNLVNLLVISDRYHVPEDEIRRVLAPGGAAYAGDGGGGQIIAKPWPDNIDEWTHYLHGPDNNAVAHDTVVGPPRHMQWLAEPRWTRTHHTLNSISAVVTAGGRIFYIVDEATAANLAVPGRWTIVARDAFSGVQLWKKGLKTWASQKNRFRSGPPQVTRLLVASGDRVYAPLGLGSPISAMDAATGKTLRTYAQTEGAEEIIQVKRVLLVLKGSPVADHAAGHPAFRSTFQSPNEKTIVALDVETGEKLWDWSDPQANPLPETLGCDGRNVYFQINQSVTCLDLKSGRQRWTFGERGSRSGHRGFGKYTLVVVDGVVLCHLSGQLTALSAEDGKKLWECKAGGGFHAPLDLFVIDGLVWQGFHTSDSVSPPPVDDFDKGRDLHTGEVKRENNVMVELQTSGHHHRCYRDKATDRYIIAGKRGLEMMDLSGDEHSRNNWIRGTCQYGILPANGLTYVPSHSCGCYMEAKLWGFLALAPKKSSVQESKFDVPEQKRLERGPAYGKIPSSGSRPGNAQSWPQYRHDPRRSGIAGTIVPPALKPAWKADLGGRLSQPVVAGRTVVLAAVDEDTVYALDEETGEVLWEATVGGRVDSPPAIHNATVLFGSADGWVYCLRLSDGELVWRRLAAPADLKTVALDRVESLWPVHGSVLVLDGVVYCAAGRSTWIDGGIDLFALDPATGRVLCRSHFESTHPKINDGKQRAKEEHVTRNSQNTTDYKTFLAPDRSNAFSMAEGSVADVLVSDGQNVFMHHVKFNAKLEKQEKMSRHLFSTSGLLDDAENHRSHWVLGTGDFSRVPVAYSWIVNGGGRRSPTVAVPTGLMMVYGDRALWGVRRKGNSGAYSLFEKSHTPFSETEEFLPDFRTVSPGQIKGPSWNASLSVRPRAMLKSGDYLFVGGMPAEASGDDPYAAFEGRSGGMIRVVSAKDGIGVAQYETSSPVVWDGMAAAGEKLFICTEKGELQCWRGE